MNEVKKIEEKDFKEEVLESTKPVLVDFWADWCMPCKKMEPIIESLAQEFKEFVRFLKLNVDENPGIASDYNIRGIPTLFLFINGEVVDRITGMVSKKDLEKKIKKIVQAR